MNKKIFLLIMLLSLFICTNNVLAFELPENAIIANSCSKNLMKPANWEVVGFKSYNDHTLVPRADIGTAYNNGKRYVSEILVPVNSKSTICFSQEEDLYTNYLEVRYLDANFEYLNNANMVTVYPRNVAGYSQCLTTLENSAYLVLSLGSSSALESAKSSNFQIELNEVTDYVAYEECIVEEPEPDDPIEPLEGMDVITNFYNVFLNNLTNFIKFASGNFAILSCLTTIVLFITVELFFKIFRR